ncbi:transferrin-like [Nasonia vitripennis]|uniref:Transferrin n=1 Tax=Nasonia vitripennis TaxID=7425 RepID=A0A7M7LIW8_NASVI|nr:transferrin-like [Nasonia vitripennis]
MGCWAYFALGAILVLAVNAEEKLRLCAPSFITPDSCNALERGDSPIRCQRVIDTAECAIQLAEGKADFGVFTADEVLLTHHFYPTGVQVVAELKNKDNMKAYETLEFQTVVVVPKSFTPTEGGFSSLIGSGLCHPGFSQSQRWNDRILKYFEQNVMNNVCRAEMTVAENEIANLKDFFKKGCRPGPWVSDKTFNEQLKKKYPELCELCDDKVACTYSNRHHHGHDGALECLTSGRGRVAYAALHYVKEYFAPNQSNRKMSDYRYLCQNGSTVSLETTHPCTWYKQPWSVILAREQDGTATKVYQRLEQASHISYGSLTWEQTLNAILFRSETPITYNNYTSPAHYLSRAMETVELPTPKCDRKLRFCTIGDMETNKCNWTSAATRILGIAPEVNCVKSDNVFQCFEKLSNKEADIISIDSNYGHLARKAYGLGPVLFSETLKDSNSIVIGVIRESSLSRRIKSLSEIKDSNVCFPEYGGIAWLSFLKVARTHRILPDSCKYPQIVANLVRAACTPGFSEANHFLGRKRPQEKLDKLCELCPTQSNGERCEANSDNAYYGDKGAIDCLKAGVGDIAFIEVGNIKDFIRNGSIIENDYRVLCKNGTLAQNTGFYVDEACAFSYTIDSEVVSRRDLKDKDRLDMTDALLKIDDWLGYRAGPEHRIIRVYESFNGTEDLLFKQSSGGLVPTDSAVKPVEEYRELFKHVDECSSAASFIATITLVLLSFLMAKFF